MSGYIGYSRSNNAAEAERCDKYPATKAAPMLGIPVGFLKDHGPTGEWHHTSKHFNCTDYYDIEACEEWLSEEETKASLETWKAERKAEPITYKDVTVEWLAWGGTRSRPIPTEHKSEGCTVQDKHGKMVVVTLPDGTTMRKGKDTNGFEVSRDGRRIWL